MKIQRKIRVGTAYGRSFQDLMMRFHQNEYMPFRWGDNTWISEIPCHIQSFFTLHIIVGEMFETYERKYKKKKKQTFALGLHLFWLRKMNWRTYRGEKKGLTRISTRAICLSYWAAIERYSDASIKITQYYLGEKQKPISYVQKFLSRLSICKMKSLW